MKEHLLRHPITCLIATACVVVFVVLELLGMTKGYGAYNAGILTPQAIADGRYYTLLSSMFMHGDLMHLGCNMVTLCYVGFVLEDILGHARFAIVYFFAGIVGGLIWYGIVTATGQVNTGVVGASGALFGLFGTYFYLLVRERQSPVVLMSAPRLEDVRGVASLLAVNIVIGFAPGISMEGHLGGLLAGLVVGIPVYELLRRTVQGEIDAGLQPPSIPAPASESEFDFDDLQASQDAAMAAQEEFARRWEEATPAERAAWHEQR
ncbi:MAG: rhomboid family intramembrane serine protease [Eggerthellaceae bacterium]|nr:rhomboid family intramembrane serine protease [Eggerthellaceae bacterium]